MSDPVVVPIWYLVVIIVCVGGTLAIQIANNDQLRIMAEMLFGRIRKNHERWEHLLNEGAFLTVDEDGHVILIVPFEDQEVLKQDPKYLALMDSLDREPVHAVPALEQFVDDRMNEPEVTVGDLPMPGMAS